MCYKFVNVKDDLVRLCLCVFILMCLCSVLEVLNNAEATFARQIIRVSSDQQKIDSSVQIQPVKASIVVEYLEC